ncbi:MAG: septum formation initiator family protein [Candidatus Dojkabacteria bacterium]|nr:septum formation initiator family protein [Candidatus Dojkabacteria bacterium]
MTHERRTAKKDRSAGMYGLSGMMTLVLSGVFVGLSVLLVANSVRSISTAYQRSQIVEQAQDEVESLRLRNLELQEQLDYVTGDTYVEKEARDRLLFTRDDEVLVVLPETSEEQGDGEEKRETVDVDADLQGWARWLDVLRNGV